MESIASDVIGGFNTFLDDQRRAPGECLFTLVQFDDQYEVVYTGVPVAEAPRLTDRTFVPRGTTALLDAIGRTIDATGRRLATLPEAGRPGRVLIVIVTDGLENASTDYTREKVLALIERQQAVYNWAFLFLAANQDAIAEAEKVGIGAQQAMTYAATGDGVREAQAELSDAVLSYRAAGKARVNRRPDRRKGKVH